MRFFLRSKKFKIMLAVTLCLAILALNAWIWNSVSPQNGIVGSITSGVQEITASVSNWFDGISKRVATNDRLLLENASLKSELNDLTSDLIDYEKTKQENEFYEKYLGIKEQHTDYIMEPAMLISRNADDPYGSFVINKGSLQGVAKYDPVITDEGLVGYITEVNPSFSVVTTVLDSSITCGGADRRTGDTGIITGELSAAEEGKTRLNSLLRTSGVATGDHIVTSGGGVFPEGLVIGKVDSVHNELHNTSLYAIITPTVDFEQLQDMMVITYFTGQGSIAEETK